MTGSPLFLIIDGYPKPSRDDFDVAGMKLAWLLYADMLHRYLPEAEYKIWLPSDTADLPDGIGLEQYDGILWTGCNLTIYHTHEARVARQIELARRAYEIGTPSFGSCWGIQMAVVAAGGEVSPGTKGREMFLARRLHLTEAGRSHPMMEGKPFVFNAFISHEDQITKLPPGAVHTVSNDFTRFQAIAVQHKKGTFWATQYHPEYALHDMARLIVAREHKLVPEGFFRDGKALASFVEGLEALATRPERKDLRWQYDVGDDVLSDDLRQTEFGNWIEKVVKPSLRG